MLCILCAVCCALCAVRCVRCMLWMVCCVFMVRAVLHGACCVMYMQRYSSAASLRISNPDSVQYDEYSIAHTVRSNSTIHAGLEGVLKGLAVYMPPDPICTLMYLMITHAPPLLKPQHQECIYRKQHGVTRKRQAGRQAGRRAGRRRRRRRRRERERKRERERE